MIRVFVSEFLCGGGREEPARLAGWAPALLGEAWVMLSAVCADFAAIPGVSVTTLLDAALPADYSLDPRVHTERVAPGESDTVFRRSVRAADYVLVIAPEFDGILADRCRIAADSGAQLLGPSPEAVALTSDKLALARCWEQAGVRTPPTVQNNPPFPLPWIVKPRFGAGSHGIRLREAELPAEQLMSDQVVIQPLVTGLPASVAFLIGPHDRLALAPCSQVLDDAFQYQGGSTPLSAPLGARALAIARQAIGCVPCLSGYVGVDVVLGERDWAIEINPRLTTSYIGLRQLAMGNIAEWLLRVVRGESVDIRWRDGTIDFQV